MIFLKHFIIYEINKLFNQIISKYKLVYSAPTTSHPLSPHMFRKSAKLRYAKSWKVNLYVSDSCTRLVLSRFEIVEHES